MCRTDNIATVMCRLSENPSSLNLLEASALSRAGRALPLRTGFVINFLAQEEAKNFLTILLLANWKGGGG